MSRSTTIVRPESNAHYYLRDGTPYHTVKSAKGEDRPTTLRDARKVNALPSTTTLLKVKANAFLESWKIEQAIKSALTLPKLPGEILDDYAVRVMEDSREQTRKAAEFGTAIHKAIERFNIEGSWSVRCFEDEALEPFMQHYVTWYIGNVEEVYRAECVLVHPLGYAGTMDLYAKLKGHGKCVVDFKTQNIKLEDGESKPSYWPDWHDQLVSYGDCLEEEGEQVDGYVSVVVNSKKPEPCFQKVWTEEKEEARERFRCCLALWKAVKKYDASFVPARQSV